MTKRLAPWLICVIFGAAVCIGAAISATAQERAAETSTAEAEELVERAENTVAILQPLLNLEQSLLDQIADLTTNAAILAS